MTQINTLKRILGFASGIAGLYMIHIDSTASVIFLLLGVTALATSGMKLKWIFFAGFLFALAGAVILWIGPDFDPNDPVLQMWWGLAWGIFKR